MVEAVIIFCTDVQHNCNIICVLFGVTEGCEFGNVRIYLGKFREIQEPSNHYIDLSNNNAISYIRTRILKGIVGLLHLSQQMTKHS